MFATIGKTLAKLPKLFKIGSMGARTAGKAGVQMARGAGANAKTLSSAVSSAAKGGRQLGHTKNAIQLEQAFVASAKAAGESSKLGSKAMGTVLSKNMSQATAAINTGKAAVEGSRVGSAVVTGVAKAAEATHAVTAAQAIAGAGVLAASTGTVAVVTHAMQNADAGDAYKPLGQ